MVAGHLQEKNNFYYIVLSYKDETGKRRTKWESTGLPVKKNKKKAEALLQERRRNFKVPTAPAEIRLDDDILFSDFMLKWLEVTKSTVQITTYASYQGMVERVIVPYLRLLAEMVGILPRAKQQPAGLIACGLRTAALFSSAPSWPQKRHQPKPVPFVGGDGGIRTHVPG